MFLTNEARQYLLQTSIDVMIKRTNSNRDASEQKASPQDSDTGNSAGERDLLRVKAELEVAQQALKHAAREIHDNLGHLANLLHLHLQLLPEASETEKVKKMDEIGMLVEGLNREIKELSIDLTATSTMREALEQLILKEVHRLKRLGMFQLNYEAPNPWPSIPEDQAIVLFRMIQEILNNILKHSEASQVNLKITQTGQFLDFSLEDNGVGFDITIDPLKPGLGVSHLYERARMIGAQIAVKSERQIGTTVHIRIPVS